MRARLGELADPANGYLDPQLNRPSPFSLPLLHNGTWAPFRRAMDEQLVPVEAEPVEAAIPDPDAILAFWD